MEFSAISLQDTVWFINRPPNNVKDLLGGVVVGKAEFSAGKGKSYILIEVDTNIEFSSNRYRVEAADIYNIKLDAINALEAEYIADGTAKSDYIDALKAE
jgi:hypothetical protein